jgi:sterol desaturase/sphingolipid hydroxylase (fatty acid hydroxylase superfamily)
MIASTVGLQLALRAGIPDYVALAGGGALVAGLVMLLERAIPYEKAWQRSRGDVVADACHMVVTGVIIGSLPGLAVASPLVDLWPAAWPAPAQGAVALVGSDFAAYWSHRLMHGPLWRVHAVHHAAPRLYWLNAWRAHPVEGVVTQVATVLPLVVIGLPREIALAVWGFSAVFEMLQHSNIDLRGGPLTWIFALPELHRWHHSPVREEADKNYGAVFIVWDALFGTRRLPARRAPVDVGIADMRDFPTSYPGQLAAPFRGRRTSEV